MLFISYTCWVLYVLTLAIFSVYCYYALLLRRWGVRWWRLLLGVQNPRSSACGKMVSIPLFSPFWTCNKFFLIRYDIIKTFVFCAYILAICMTTWSWAYIWGASGFGLKTGCDRSGTRAVLTIGRKPRIDWMLLRTYSLQNYFLKL
jgi:hypothetical protein